MLFKRLLLIMILVLSASHTQAALVTLDFESLQGTGTSFGSFESYGNSVEQNGFTLTTGAVFGGFISYLPGSPLYTGSIALIPNQSDATTILTQTDLSAFSIFSIALGFSDLAQPGSSDITFFGQKSDTSVIQQTFNISSSLSNFNFSANFNDLVSLTWTHTAAAANNHRFDDINVDGDPTHIPEPSGFLVSLTGLFLLFFRKNNKIG